MRNLWFVGYENSSRLIAVFFRYGDAVNFIGRLPRCEDGLYYIDRV
jgi:hypothetical protein